jgi:hypothetical protein
MKFKYSGTAQIKTAHTKTGTPDYTYILVMPFTTQSRLFSLPVCYLKAWSLKYIELWFCMLFCVCMKLGLSHCRKNTGCGVWK